MLCVRDELVNEHVVVGCVSDRAPDDTDRKRKGGDGSNEILTVYQHPCIDFLLDLRCRKNAYIRADDGRDNGGRDNNASDTETCYHKQTPKRMEVVCSGTCKGANP